nr:6-phosphofructokinase [Victivallales bacterium]
MGKLKIKQFKPAKYISPILKHVKLPPGKKMPFTSDKYELPSNLIKGLKVKKDEDISFELAGAREKVFFKPENTKAAIVTCGGLCPGLNDVIWGIVTSLFYWYDVKNILGIRYGYSGLAKDTKYKPLHLNPETLSEIQEKGGSFLGTARGNPPVEEMVDTLVKMKVDILFCIGGDGTLRGAHKIYEEIQKRNLQISVIGVPKTIDNDIFHVERSFGFHTSIEEAKKVLDCAHVEAKGADNCIGLVKLMGRDAGYIAAYATKASGNVNYCLIPEIKF